MLTTNGTSIAAGKRRYFQEEGGFKSGDLSVLEWNKGYCVSVKTVYCGARQLPCRDVRNPLLVYYPLLQQLINRLEYFVSFIDVGK